MHVMNNTAQKIVETAIGMMCQGGYHAFSFRQLANELDIKSASIHYYFPSKSDLGVAAMRVYSDKFSEQIHGLQKSSQPLMGYLKIFEKTLRQTQAACLAGILASECGELPPEVLTEVENFRNLNLEWIRETLVLQRSDWSKEEAARLAELTFSALQGALAFSAMSRKPENLKQVTKALESLLKIQSI